MSDSVTKLAGLALLIGLAVATPPGPVRAQGVTDAYYGAQLQRLYFERMKLCNDSLQAGDPAPPACRTPPPVYYPPPQLAGPVVFTTCAPLGNGGRRCTTQGPGGVGYMTCYPIGYGQERCAAQ